MQILSDEVRTKLEYILIFSTAGVSLLIAILDLTGLLDSSSWVAQRVPSLTLLAVAFVASYLILERQGKIDVMATNLEERSKEILQAISRSTTSTISALDGVEVVSFASSAELVTYASERFREATQINDVTWGSSGGPQPRSREDIEAYQKYQNAISDIAKSPRTVWREVVIFRSKEHFEREKKRILDPDNIAYNLAYYELMPISIAPPRIGFAVIDNEEVLVSYSPKDVRLSIKHPDIARYFSFYFEDIWEHAKKLKQANSVDHQELERLETELIGHLQA